MGISAALLLAGGALAWIVSIPRPATSPESAGTPAIDLTSVPAVAQVTCGARGTRTTTPVVRARPDGIHVVFHNRAGFREYFFPTPPSSPSADLGHGGPLRRGATKALTSNGPGEFLVGCFRNAQDEGDPGDPRYVRIVAVDPQHLFTPEILDCHPGKRGIYRRVGSTANLEAIVRTIPGVDGGDEVLRPGYPDEPFMVEARVVIRDGRVVARITLFGQGWLPPPPGGNVEWKLWVDPCPESGIGAPAGT
jgi:hypothetical protein